MSDRIFNFSAGPAVLPEQALSSLKDNLLNYAGTGIGLMETSHRSKAFTSIIQEAEVSLRSLLSLSDDYAVVFATGGASNQFSMVPMNLLSDGATADYIVTGSWSKKALKEAAKFGEVRTAASSEDKNFNYIPTQLELSSDPAYVHFTSNNTIAGTQFSVEPACGGAALVCDASSDLLYKPIDVSKYGIIYAGAQKNLGPAGVTLVIIRKSLLERIPDGLPVMMDYRTYESSGSLYNTPPTLPIYVMGEVFKWILDLGGLDAMEKRNRDKAGLLYDEIDASDFYRGVAEKESRSLMNVTLRLPNEELEAKFVEAASTKGLNGLKGHRSVGGIRASIYNAFPPAGVEALVEFMRKFEKENS